MNPEALMNPDDLQLARLTISNYKSVRRLELRQPSNLMVFIGRNNAGKSNILDCLVFLGDATKGFEHALESRGGTLTAILHKKRPQEHVEVTFDFVLPEAQRAEFIARLFSGNRRVSVTSAMASHFLRRLTLRVRFGNGEFVDELTTTNLRPEGPPCVIFLVRGGPGGVESLGGQLEALCEKCSDELPSETVVLAPSAAPNPSFRLCLGLPDGTASFPVSRQLAELVHEQLAGLQRLEPMRQSANRVRIQGESELTPTASNLADVLHWLYNNRPRLFRRIESEAAKLVPGLGSLYTPTFASETTVGLIEGEDEELTFTMEQMSFGTKNAIAILTKVLLAKPGAWVCIEEPETHLHPQAQQQLLAFLKLEARRKRILVATHSTAFAAATPLGSLYLVERDAANCTAASAVTEKEAARVIHQLGVLSAYDFAAEAVVFVPEADDLPLFTAWAAAAGLAGKVQFLDSEDGHTLQFFANTRVASSERVQTLVYAVFGASPVQDAAAREVRERIVNRLALPAGHAVILDVAEPETYLFEAKALLRACGNLKVTEPDLEQRLVSCRGEPGAKPVLRELLSSLRAGVYDAEVGGRIAAAMDAVPAPVSRLFADIAAQTQPFADI